MATKHKQVQVTKSSEITLFFFFLFPIFMIMLLIKTSGF